MFSSQLKVQFQHTHFKFQKKNTGYTRVADDMGVTVYGRTQQKVAATVLKNHLALPTHQRFMKDLKSAVVNKLTNLDLSGKLDRFVDKLENGLRIFFFPSFV
mgnify:CR=1 FL=1